MTKYLYRETSDVWFDKIDEYLRTNKIDFNYVDIPYTSWRCYRVSVTEAEKLPKWDGMPYLPVAIDEGFELWHDPLDYEVRAIQFGGWK